MIIELLRREFLRLKPKLMEYMEDLPYYIIVYTIGCCAIFGAICFVGYIYATIIGRI